MKTYKQFIVDSYDALKDLENIQEIVPLIAAAPAIIGGAAKLGGAALTAYSAYQTAKKLKKGDYKGAGIEALGMIPAGGIAAKGVSKLPAVANLINKGNKLQRGVGKTIRATTGLAADTARMGLPTERNKLINKGIDKGVDKVLGTSTAQADNSTAPANSNTSAANSNTSQSNQSTAKKKQIDLKKLPGAGLAMRTDLSSPTMRTKSQAEAEQGIENDNSGSTTTQNANSDAAKKNTEAQQKAKEAEEKKKALEAQRKKNQELNDKLRPDFSMAG